MLGAVIGAVALPVGLHSGGTAEVRRSAAHVLLTLAICSHHFTAMGAVSIIPDPTIVIPQSAIPPAGSPSRVALGSFVIIAVRADRRRASTCASAGASELEADRMRGLANAAIEGLMVCDGTTIVTVNNSLAGSAGRRRRHDRHRHRGWLPDATARAQLLSRARQPRSRPTCASATASCRRSN